MGRELQGGPASPETQERPRGGVSQKPAGRSVVPFSKEGLGAALEAGRAGSLSCLEVQA